MSEEEEAAAKVEGGGNEDCSGYFFSQDVLCLCALLSLARALCRCKHEAGMGPGLEECALTCDSIKHLRSEEDI